MIKLRNSNFKFRLILLFVVSNFILGLKAQIVSPFNIRYQVNQKGGIVMLSNVGLTCNTNNPNCGVFQSQFPPNGNHNQDGGVTLGYVDADSDPSTWMSSSDSLNLSDCSQVTWAGLYWSARINNNTVNFSKRNQVKIKSNNGTYQNLTADQVLDVQNIPGNPNFSMLSYYCFKDITKIVQATNGKGRFTIANIVSETGMENLFGAWSIIVVYKNQLVSMRNLTVFDGMAFVSNNNNLDIPISGFVTPQVGPVNFELGVVAYEGDRNIAGDRLQFNGNGSFLNVPDPLRSPTDFFNSTLTFNGALTPFRNPNYNNTLGFDTGIFLPDNSAKGYIGNNATSATVRVATSQDAIIPRVITSAIDIYEPDLRATVYINDLNGAPAQPNDILEYTVIAKNIGSDVSANTYLIDTLDLRTNYVPNSISFLNGPFVGAKTDVSSDDQAEYDALTRTIKARVSTGANAFQGGSMNNSPTGIDSAVIRFRVKVVDDCILLSCNSTLENKAYLYGTGIISGNTFNNGGASDLYDSKGCPSSTSNLISVYAPNCPPIDITSNNPLCQGDTLKLSVPNSIYANYLWSGPNGFTSTISNPIIPNLTTVNNGVYNLTIALKDGSCQYNNLTTNVSVNPLPSIQLNSLNHVKCFNDANGTIQVLGIGNAPFTYSWVKLGNNAVFSTNNTISGLSPGSYIVAVRDLKNCIAKDTFEITQPTVLVANSTVTSNFNGQNISCFGASDGSASVTFSGGTSPYTLKWSNGTTTQNITNLGPGTYTATITDLNGCLKSTSVTLTQPTAINISETSAMVSCYGQSNGSIDLSVNGGTPGYTYSWSNGLVSQDISSLTAGAYDVSVKDLNGCTKSKSITVSQPNLPLSLSETHMDVLCFGKSSGSVNLNVSGGTLPYSYLWSNGSITEDLSNLSSGTYTVSVKDSKNCEEQLTVVISQPNSPLSSTVSISDVLCFGGSSGSVDLEVFGGTSPYTYLWNNGSVSEDLNGLKNGNYSVVIKDKNACETTNSLVVSQPLAPLTYQFLVDNPNCFGSSDGNIDLTVSGGTLPYSYSWSNGQVTQDLAGISFGTYFVSVTDANQCKILADTNLIEPSPLQMTFTKVDVKCFGDATGSIDVSVSGGTKPYSFKWSNGTSTEDLIGLKNGMYQLTITDSLGCQLSNSVEIQQPTAPLALSVNHTDALCIGGKQGTINLSVVGGTGTYSYNWNNGQTSEDVQNLVAGYYYCLVTDFNLCSDTIGATILDPSNTMVLSESHVDVSCYAGSDGQIDLNVAGGAPNYSYLWSNGETTQDLSSLNFGNYYLTVTDKNACQSFISVSIKQPLEPLKINYQVNHVLCFGFQTGSINLSVVGGTSSYTYLWNNGATAEDLMNLGSGTYTIGVKDSKGCIENSNITINQPSEIEITETHQEVSCFGGNDGQIDVTINGGVSPFKFNWDNGKITEDISTLSFGNYTLVVTDANNCSKSKTIEIKQPLAPISLKDSVVDVSCYGGNNGSIDITPLGGNGNYQFAWSNGTFSEDLQNLISGSYSVLVKDSKNCTHTQSFIVKQPLSPLSLTIKTTPAKCYAESNGTAVVLISGGTPGYKISWDNGAVTDSIFGLQAGSYLVIVRDTNGCEASLSALINQPNLLKVNADSTDVKCFGEATGSVVAFATGGVLPYSYLWNNNLNSSFASNLIAGTYKILVKDFNGCVAQDSTVINQPISPLKISFLIIDNSCYGGSNGEIDANVSGGTSPYSYQWSNNGVSDIITSLPVGNYQLQVTDFLGCKLTKDTLVRQPNKITATAQTKLVSCFNGSDGALDVTINGGVQPYKYSWSNAQNTQDLTNLVEGNYSLTVLDSNNCEEKFTFAIAQPDSIIITYNEVEPSCFGYSDGQLVADASGGVSPYAFTWSNGDKSPIADSLNAADYTLSIVDANGCPAAIKVTLNQPDQLRVSFDADVLKGCSPLTVKFRNSSDPSIICLWDFGDGQTFTGCDEVTNTFISGGTFDVNLEIIDANGCKNHVTYENFISVTQTPVADFNLSPQQLFAFSNTTSITNQSLGGDIFVWNLGDGSSTNVYFEPGEHSYPINLSDTFLITLVAKTVDGCADTLEKILLFNNDPFFYVPNTFIPDDNGTNDIWKPVFSSSDEIKRYSLEVYNRWGELVFQTNDPQEGWDGTFGRQKLKAQDGSYVWKLQFEWRDYKVYPATGHVNLIR